MPVSLPEMVHKVIIRTRRGKFVSRRTADKDGKGNGCGKDFPDPGSKACAGPGFIKEQDKKYQ